MVAVGKVPLVVMPVVVAAAGRYCAAAIINVYLLPVAVVAVVVVVGALIVVIVASIAAGWGVHMEAVVTGRHVRAVPPVPAAAVVGIAQGTVVARMDTAMQEGSAGMLVVVVVVLAVVTVETPDALVAPAGFA